MKEARPKHRILRGAALIAVALGAVGSEYLMFRVGRRNPSPLLMTMFAGWVLAPFAALAWCHAAAPRWTHTARTLLQIASLLVAIGSLAIYGYIAFGPSRPQPAFSFLVVPLASLVVIAALVAACTRRRQNV